MTGLLLTAALVVGAPAADSPAPKTIVQWRRDVQEALILQAHAKTPAERSDAIRTLGRLHDEVRHDARLPSRERLKLRVKLASRLRKIQTQLKRDSSSTRSTSVSTRNQINEQGKAGGGAVGPGDHGQELVDLIQATVAPESWVENGGVGVAQIARMRAGRGAGARGGGVDLENYGEDLVDLIQSTIAPDS